MATWIIVIGAALAVVILAGALLVVMVSTRDRPDKGGRRTGLQRLLSRQSPESPEPDPPTHAAGPPG
jgi:hypothetical protein